MVLYRRWGTEKDFVSTYTSSIDSDKEIVEEVKVVMKAHVIELYLSGYIAKDTAKRILLAINSFHELKEGYEDIHEALEDHIIKTVGEEGGWVGFGRSRNDHVATALRLKMRKYLVEILYDIISLRKTLIEKSKTSTEILFPTYTHFQPAQPSTLAHYFLYIEDELDTIWNYIYSSLLLVNRSPLGSGAIVGTNVKLDRKREAELLGFDDIIYNTISATSSRLDLINAVSNLSLLMLFFSRIAEDLILLSSMFINIVKLPDSHVSTSSLMPQKRNAVTLEILRSKAGECFGDLSSLFNIYKGLPSGYNLDLQEMNKHYWDCVKIVISSIEVINSILEGIEVLNFQLDDKTTATDVAEDLAITGIPYRKAYMEVANKIRAGTFISEISPKTSIYKKAVMGSPNPELIKEEIKIKENRIVEEENKLKKYEEKIIGKMNELKVIEDDLIL
ncbi:argininosuccinate lyase [Sulfurisphaera ohwakuensis]|uniref:Argininosuccinate lyase n=1 Tax=Sulfurisphaera ohwakuensis TaxID=69656 RepID=A0A650CHG0_SULOH|nr:argininosuccinate lyase [Sulfurisphaera ohwakuensis]MBB5252324.1 argininosuccinate lyase [Sulfurisphaera ohwakuensis]QGR17213.1 argininosuccinate lyase [Sulfurisphaera ohwakuensis]